MVLLLIALCASSIAPQHDDGDTFTLDEVETILLPLYGSIRDFDILYEGSSEQILAADESGLPEALKKAGASRKAGTNTFGFQGTLAYRQDVSFHIDMHRRFEKDDSPPTREIVVLSSRKISRRLLVPDRGGPVGPDESTPGHIGNLLKAGNPLLFISFPLVASLARNKQSFDYKFVGLDELQGNRCVVLEFFVDDPSTGQPGWRMRFWIDLARGGHPIQSEKYDGANLVARSYDVKLVQVPLEDGASVWFPISGRYQSFVNGFNFTRTPTIEQEYVIVRENLRLNQDLPDRRFTLDWGLDEPTRRASRQLSLAAPSPLKRSDVEDAEARLATALDAADRQAKPLLADPRPPWYSRFGLQLTLGACGFMLLIASVALWRRQA